MASIIAQLVAAKRRRMENRKYSIDISKSVYNLNSYDRSFKAEKHNSYIKNRSALNRKDLVKTIAKGKVQGIPGMVRFQNGTKYPLIPDFVRFLLKI